MELAHEGQSEVKHLVPPCPVCNSQAMMVNNQTRNLIEDRNVPGTSREHSVSDMDDFGSVTPEFVSMPSLAAQALRSSKLPGANLNGINNVTSRTP
jgi:hypothetical protein